MRLRPLGWELSLFLLTLGLVGVGLATSSTPLVIIALTVCAVAAPLVIVSFFVRLAAGIVDEDRRRRLRRSLT